MQKLQWILFRSMDKLGALGMTALTLALLVMLYLLVALWPAQHRLQALDKAPTHPQRDGKTPMVTESPARVFLAAFPGPEGLSEQLQTVFDVAAQYGLGLDEVSYKQEKKQGERMSQYYVDFSLNAPYPDTRAFLSDVLAALPYVSLDQLSFDRESVKSDSVQTRIRLTLHLVQR